MQLAGIEPFRVQGVRFTPGKQLAHAFQFDFIGGHQQLAGLLERQSVLSAKRISGRSAFPAEAGFEASRFVIYAGVNDTAVMSGLMLCGRSFFFQQQDSGPGLALLKLPCGGETDNAGTDDDEVVFHSSIEITFLSDCYHSIMQHWACE